MYLRCRTLLRDLEVTGYHTMKTITVLLCILIVHLITATLLLFHSISKTLSSSVLTIGQEFFVGNVNPDLV